jgi:hypothetical protein
MRAIAVVCLVVAMGGASMRKSPFRQPHYLILNLAIGGMNGGDPSQTEFPARVEVDYIRVFQKGDRQRDQQ